jgi:TonB family protein
MSCPNPYRPTDPVPKTADSGADFKIHDLVPSDAEVRSLTDTLAASGGGSSSKDLALDLVLNQIVEQACLATGATGAAIALLRDGEMVCRATTGRNAPDLGTRLDNAGFSAECLRIGTLQRCDDTETDPRVDTVACRLLGVRSILVVPLWYWGEFMGIFEIFAPRPNAFGERDEQTLQALAYRIVRQAKQANGMITGFAETSTEIAVPPPPPAPRNPIVPEPEPMPIRIIETESSRPTRTTPVVEFTTSTSANERPDIWTMLLAGFAILIACAIVGLMIWRVGWTGDEVKKVAAAPEQTQTAPQAEPARAAPAAQEEILEFGSPVGSSAPTAKAASSSGEGAVVSPATLTNTTPPPPSAGVDGPQSGGLAIYDHGKLIYGAPLADSDAPSVKNEAPKSVPVKTRLTAKMGEPASLAQESSKGRYAQLNPEAADALLMNRVEPEYPDAARRAQIQGTVTVDTVVGADGKVLEANAVDGSPQLTDAATAAVRQWRYKPHVVNGKKVAFRTQVPVTFMLPQ